jgi:hypothetical protein
MKPSAVTALPTDVALAVASAGIDIELEGDTLADALRSAIADRGSHVDVSMSDIGRTRELALAWCLIFLVGEGGEIGTPGFAA